MWTRRLWRLGAAGHELRRVFGDFNHQYRGAPAGRGGSFNRVSSFQIVFDLALAYGNPAFYNPSSKYLPPGIPEGHFVPLSLLAPDKESELAAKRPICALTR